MATAGGLHVADIPGLTAERVFGRSRVVGTDLEISGWCRATQLVVDFPGVRLGVDADADVPWLRSVRGQCAALTLEIDGARLSVAVSAAARALDWVEEVRVDLLDDELRVVIQLTGKTAATVSARVGVVVEGATLVLVPFEYLALGAAPAPSAATFAVCAAALLASPELSPLIRAVERVGDCVRIEPARAGLAAAFCRAGWKLPGTELIEIGEVRIAPGRALVSASGSRGGRAATSRAARQAFAAWAERLDEPALTAALEARDESSLEAVALARVEASALARAIVLEAQVRDDPDAAVSVANERLSEVAGDAAALAALVSASVTRGDSEALVRACRALVEALGRAGRQDDQILVILFAASVLAPTAPTTASKWIDAALKLAPRDAGALRMRVKLARQLGDVDAYEDGLARLLALARARSVKARLHRELGRVARDHRRDPVRAWRHFADAASLVPDDALSWVLCGQAQAEAGAPVEAVQSLRSGLRVARTDDELVGPTAALTAAKLWADSLGDAAAAHRELRAAIERWPGSVALLDALDALDAGLPLPAAAHLPTTAAHVAVGASAQRGVASATPPTATEPAPFPAARAPDAQPAPGSASNEARGVARARALARVASARDAGDERGLASALADAASLEPDAGARAALLAELGELLYYELEEEERATQYLEEAARLDPTGVGQRHALLSALERVYRDRSAHEPLLDVYRTQLGQATTTEIRGVYRLLIAGVLLDVGAVDDADTVLADALAAEPRSVPALRLLARARLAAGRGTEAVEVLRRLVALPEVDAFERQDCARQLAHLEVESGDLAAAVARFEALLAEIPGDTDVLASLRSIHVGAGSWDHAIELLGRELWLLAGVARPSGGVPAVDDVPPPLRSTAAGIWLQIAEIAARAEQQPRAIAALQSALDASTSDIDVLEHAARRGAELGADAVVARALAALAPLMLPGSARDETVAAALSAAQRAGTGSTTRDALGELAPSGSAPPPQRSTSSSTSEPPIPQATRGAAAATTGGAIGDDDARLRELDRRALEGDDGAALAAIEAWLPTARRTELRYELLIRKGRWMLDRGLDPRAASLPLKGALILAPRSPRTRLELFRVSCALGDASQAVDQLREYLDALAGAVPDDEDLRRFRGALTALSALPRGPVEAWLRDEIVALAPLLAAALFP